MSENDSPQGANQPSHQHTELTEAQRRRQEFDRLVWDTADYLTRRAADKAARKQATDANETD